ncbi:amidase [Allosediminivita pacifica]|uniref:Aspartyl-tRNA(Asn)/glutamyl-tRNA(Gln) amidotransferase subunit A n=1 Tax=Allosediminivita pacifica TaxID=1267769 RepID=A0A2T6ANI8_9RHOB|nr:amidase [Allosediminivita pacifica]PTX45391.1 aspartyl-tRNA(Asn)/glutamyl-tRNA(Gln) amidotransferase subunit A [Allosediminivita pacifica]GGB20928.1 glutamyl-tRNA(Gln) amidotransferase [Allosediminivita pacifica]
MNRMERGPGLGLSGLSVTEAGARLRRGEVSPVDLVDACLSRIAATQDELNLYITVLDETARTKAVQAEMEIRRGRLRGPLHGIPFAVKDNYHVKGVLTTAGSRLMLDHMAEETATIIARLEAAGAILLGKLNTWEYGTGNGEVHHDLPFPVARNPWNPDRFTGGSSTGAGAAVAAGAAMFALGSDTGGSVRLPAAACGVQGMKATFGRISRKGMLPNCWSSDVPGPLTWTAEDNALVLSMICGVDPLDESTRDVPVPDFAAGLRAGRVEGMRIGVVRDFGEGAPAFQPALAENCERMAKVLEGLGAVVEEARLPAPLPAYRNTLSVINWSESYSIHEKDFLERHHEMGFALRDKMMSGSMVRAADYLAAQRYRRELSAATDAMMQSYDAVLMPTTSMVAPAFGDNDVVRAYTYAATTSIQNVTGHPAFAVASGFDDDGMPTSVQITTKYFDELTALVVAHAWERAADPREARPAA